jgi:hypothetical protein
MGQARAQASGDVGKGPVLAWTMPQGWKAKPLGAMRLASYEVPGSAGPADCLVIALAGDGGGLRQNVNFWRWQMSLAESGEEEMAASLQKIEVAGVESTLVDFAGRFAGHTSEAASASEEDRLLGVVVPLGDRTFFIKMVGPRATVDEQSENFLSFCRSFARQSD